jgi:streptogramin lyase
VSKSSKKLLNSIALIVASASFTAPAIQAYAAPSQDETVYLFAGDRTPNADRAGSIHRYTWDASKPTAAVPAPAAGQEGALWGGKDAKQQGLDFSGMALGPEGDLYVVSTGANSVFRIDGKTGLIKATVIKGLDAPDGSTIGTDGNLYIADNQAIRRVKRDGTPLPGAEQIGNVFTRGSQLNTASGLTFGPDGNLYVASQNWKRIVRYDGRTGEFIDVFNIGDVMNPTALAFGPDGDLYVSSVGGPGFNAESGYVVRLNGKTGESKGIFAPEAKGALGLTFGPNGNLFVSNYWNGKVSQFDGKTGAPLGVYAEAPVGGALYTVLFAVPGTKLNVPLQPYKVQPRK